MGFVFSSESVSEGHPDKVADQVSDAILDAMLRVDPYSRVACETFVTAHRITLGGEVTSTFFDDVGRDEANARLQAIAQKTIARIGYDHAEDGMWDGAHLEPVIDIVQQSPDIAQGTSTRSDGQIGAGDQGMMFGYAQRNVEDGREPAALARQASLDDDYMPVPISLAHGLTKATTRARRHGSIPYLRPDSKSQVSVRYENGKPVGVDAIVLACQHDPDVDQETIAEDLREKVVAQVIPEEWITKDTEFYINHTGKFVIGGPAADTGLTGRKIIVDTYGGWIPHGGGAFSGKDCIKVDRSAAYYARYAAKNLVAAGVADKLQIQVAYSIGSLRPVSYYVDTYGTGTLSDRQIIESLKQDFSFAPGSIIDELDLRRPIYEPTAAYGHFGRRTLGLPWERLDRVEALAPRIPASRAQ